jgi:hypothetical protein
MEYKKKNIQKILHKSIKDKKLNTFSSGFEIKESLSKAKFTEKQNLKNNIKNDIEKKHSEKQLMKAKKGKSNSKQKIINKIILSKLTNLKANKEKKLSTIEIEKQQNKKHSYQNNKNNSQNKDSQVIIKDKKSHAHGKIERSTTLQVFTIKEPKKNILFNVNNLICPNDNNNNNNIRTIDTELAQTSDLERERNTLVKGNIQAIMKEFKDTQDDIDINTTNQDTKYKSEKYLSIMLFNAKKYKKLYQKYKKENDLLKKENNELKNTIQETKDELDIMKEEVELNKDYNKENIKKFNELKEFVKQNNINYEQKIFSLKELLFSKDEEIKINKIIDYKDSKNNNIIEDLKKRLAIKEQIIQN